MDKERHSSIQTRSKTQTIVKNRKRLHRKAMADFITDPALLDEMTKILDERSSSDGKEMDTTSVSEFSDKPKKN